MSARSRLSRHRACIDKAGRYDTRQKAQVAAANYALRYPAALPRVAYRCPFSKKGAIHFHIGRPLGVHAENRR